MKLKQLFENKKSFEEASAFAKRLQSAIHAVDVAIEYNIQDPELERILIKENNRAQIYRYVQHFGRFKLYEQRLIEHENYHGLVDYITKGLNVRVPELESFILSQTSHLNAANQYLRHFPEAWNPSKDVPVVLYHPFYIGYAIIDLPNTITDDQLKKVIKLSCSNAVNDAELEKINTIRIYYERYITQRLQAGRFVEVTINDIRNDKRIQKEFLSNTGLYVGMNSDFVEDV